MPISGGSSLGASDVWAAAPEYAYSAAMADMTAFSVPSGTLITQAVLVGATVIAADGFYIGFWGQTDVLADAFLIAESTTKTSIVRTVYSGSTDYLIVHNKTGLQKTLKLWGLTLS